MKRRRLGTALILLGLLAAAYAAAVLLWRDPVTDLWARYQQHRLAAQLERAYPAYEFSGGETLAADGLRRELAEAARDFEGRLRPGSPMGRLEIPRIGLDAVFVHGTRWWPDLSKGPGHYRETAVPGLGKTMGIAGHRTTFGAPFRKIDRLGRGDDIVLRLPYGTFRYEVFRHRIVAKDDWSIVRGRGFDTIVLSACHPLYSAEQRWVVFGRLVEVRLRGTERLLVLAGDGGVTLR